MNKLVKAAVLAIAHVQRQERAPLAEVLRELVFLRDLCSEAAREIEHKVQRLEKVGKLVGK